MNNYNMRKIRNTEAFLQLALKLFIVYVDIMRGNVI